MRKEIEDRIPYVNPEIEVIEFQLEESIATSLDFGPSTMCGEEMW